MKKAFRLLVLLMPIIWGGCKETKPHPYPQAYIDFEINLGMQDYYLLNFPSNYVYVQSGYGSSSRGIIIYRMPYNEYEFRVYDRFPPNYPDACCDGQGNCSRLVTDGLFIIDECSDIKYNILDGSIFEGEGEYELIQYHWSYNANNHTLHVFN